MPLFIFLLIFGSFLWVCFFLHYSIFYLLMTRHERERKIFKGVNFRGFSRILLPSLLNNIIYRNDSSGQSLPRLVDYFRFIVMGRLNGLTDPKILDSTEQQCELCMAERLNASVVMSR